MSVSASYLPYSNSNSSRNRKATPSLAWEVFLETLAVLRTLGNWPECHCLITSHRDLVEVETNVD